MTYGKNGGFGKNEVIFQIKVLCICLRPLIQVMCKFEQNWSSSFCIGFAFTQNIFVLANIYLNSFFGLKMDNVSMMETQLRFFTITTRFLYNIDEKLLKGLGYLHVKGPCQRKSYSNSEV